LTIPIHGLRLRILLCGRGDGSHRCRTYARPLRRGAELTSEMQEMIEWIPVSGSSRIVAETYDPESERI